MAKNILVINGNPKANSFCQQLSDAYECQARDYYHVQRINLAAMAFNPSLECGYDEVQPLEPCLLAWQQAIRWADHLVIVAPIWWGGLPAKLKGLFDRTFLPEFAFKFLAEEPIPQQLLKGKTARLILTMDAQMEDSVTQAAPAIAQLDRYTLQFCGVAPTAINLFGSVILSDASLRASWLQQIEHLARQGA